MHILEILGEMKGGRVADQLTEDMHELTEAVRRHRGKGKLVLEIACAPGIITDGEVKEIQMSYSVKVTTPRPNHGKTGFFTLPNGDLSRRDPAQMEMELGVEDARRPQ